MLHILRPLPMPVAAFGGAPLAPITITSSATFSIPENSTAVATLTATGGTGSFTWSKIGGADTSKFTLTSGGVLTFTTAPDFEVPTDANTDNVYLVQVQADDGVSTPATQNVSVTVTDVAEAVLDLDFAAMGGTLDSRITLTRAGSATYVNSAGVISTASTNVARFEHHPTTHAVLGLLFEAAVENEVRQSHAFGTSPWALNNATLATGVSSPDGGSNAATITGNGSSTRNGVGQTFGTRVTGASTWSIWAKPGTSNYLVIEGDTDGAGGTKRKAWFNLSTGAVGTTEAGVTASMQAFDGGWYRCSLNLTTTVTTGGTMFVGPAAADGTWAAETGTISVFGAQFETNTVTSPASSYIPTTTTSVTRAVDNAVMTGTNFSSWYNASAGTFVVQFVYKSAQATGRMLIAANNNTSNERIHLISSGPGATITCGVTDGGTLQASLNAGSLVLGVLQKVAAAYALNDFAMSVNGGTVATDTTGTLPSPDRMHIGSNESGTQPMYGLFTRIAYYNTRKSNSDLIILST